MGAGAALDEFEEAAGGSGDGWGEGCAVVFRIGGWDGSGGDACGGEPGFEEEAGEVCVVSEAGDFGADDFAEALDEGEGFGFGVAGGEPEAFTGAHGFDAEDGVGLALFGDGLAGELDGFDDGGVGVVGVGDEEEVDWGWVFRICHGLSGGEGGGEAGCVEVRAF